MQQQAAWERCINRLGEELSISQINTWIMPLRAEAEGNNLHLIAPNEWVKQWVEDHCLKRIVELLGEERAALEGVVLHFDRSLDDLERVNLEHVDLEPVNGAPVQQDALDLGEEHAEVRPGSGVNGSDVNGAPAWPTADEGGWAPGASNEPPKVAEAAVPGAWGNGGWNPGSLGGDIDPSPAAPDRSARPLNGASRPVRHENNLAGRHTFDSFVEGKSNQQALAAAKQVVESPGGTYNPLFLCGGSGLGKTHLMQAVGNALLQRNPQAKVVYLSTERFVRDLVKAIRLRATDDFKRYYRSVDALLIDDIQFLVDKDQSQEEFFYTFDDLLQGRQQMILTCDRYPKEIDGIPERLRSRFGWGLTMSVEPPDMETRAAILMKKAEEAGMDLPLDAAMFIADKFHSNVRDLEGALKKVEVSANSENRPIDIDMIKESLKDILNVQSRQVKLGKLQRTVADHYGIKVADMLSRRRTRSLVRPRQMAMYLTRELTNHSLPEIGDRFGGRDHTTVLHACRKIEKLRQINTDIDEDHRILMRLLTT